MDSYSMEMFAKMLANNALLLLPLSVIATILLVVAIIVAVHLFGLVWELSSRYLHTTFQITSRPNTNVATAVLGVALGLVVTVAGATFVILAESVFTAGRMAQFDVLFAAALRSTVTPSWERFFGFVSRAGSPDVMAVATLMVGCALLFRRETVVALGWVVAQLGSALIIYVLKTTFVRTRPELAGWSEPTWGFPSGHALGTFVFLGVGCYLLLRQIHSATLAIGILTTSVVWCLLISFSRLYLGVHFASDVVAGAFAGAAWVSVCIAGFELGRCNAQQGTRVGEPRQRTQHDTAA